MWRARPPVRRRHERDARRGRAQRARGADDLGAARRRARRARRGRRRHRHAARGLRRLPRPVQQRGAQPRLPALRHGRCRLMAIATPTLDDRSFEQLYDEARSLIPRYTPEWTDHNEVDPGATMLQLHAWFTEQLLYRLNQVPERNYRKFLQLLGIDVKPAAPARVDVTFTTAKLDTDAIVPAGTQVAVGGGGGEGAPIVFELPQAFVAIGPALAAVQVY